MKQMQHRLLTVSSEKDENAYLMPADYEKIIMEGNMDYKNKVWFSFMIATGLRMREFQQVSMHPENFMPDRKVIKVFETKKKRKQQTHSRYVKLSDWGLKMANAFFEINGTMPIKRRKEKDASVYDPDELNQGRKVRTIREHVIEYRWYYDSAVDYYLKKWANKAGIDPSHFNVKSLRKTNVIWLVASHPDREGDIAQSIGHSIMTDIHNYRNTPFSSEDVLKARKYMAGWGYEDIPEIVSS